MHDFEKKSIYQGEPMACTVFVRDEARHYRPSLDDYEIEAMLYDSFGKVVKKWSTAEGGIDIRTVTVGDETRGCATFWAEGSETACWHAGDYTLEVAKVLSGGRAIGVQKLFLHVDIARIKKGVSHE